VTVSIRQCTELPASPEQVWRTIGDVTRHVEWMRDAAEITPVGMVRGAVGDRFSCLTTIGPLRTRDEMRVTEWEPGAVMAIAHEGAVQGTGRFTLTAAGAVTRFCWDEVLRFPWWMGGPVGERAAKPVLARVWRGNLARLRDLVETGSPGAG